MPNKKTLLITGTLGFIGSNFVRQFVAKYPDWKFIGVDKGVHKFNLYNQFEYFNYKFYMGDIADAHFMDNVFDIEKPAYVINMAAESFVDSSISSAMEFVHSNISGTQVMIDKSLKYSAERFIQISTDEVYGQLASETDKSWTEESPLNPRNPYSASKASAEMLVRAAIETHKLPAMITRCCNNYGPRQQPMNLMPKCFESILNNIPVPISGNGKNVREWIFVEDHNNAIMTVLEKGSFGEIYNIGSGIELSNLKVVEAIGKVLDKNPNIKFVADRKGHDFRYSVDFSKLKKLGWQANVPFTEGLSKCANWYRKKLST